MTTRIHSDLFTYRRVSLMLVSALIFAVLPAATVHAAEWRIEPSIRVGGEFDDNANLTTRTDVDADISGYLIDASAKFAYASETTDFFVEPKLRKRDYGDPLFDSDDQFLPFNFSHDTQNSNFRIWGQYAREGIRTAERADADLEVEDPDEIADNESGRVRVRGHRDSLYINPSWTYRTSRVSSIRLNLGLIDVSYDGLLANLLTNYSDARVSASYLRNWSPRNTAILTAGYRQFEPEGSNKLTGTSLNAGFERRLTETTRLRALIGLEESTDEVTDQSDTNWVADISLTRNLQTITMLAQYRRTVSGGGIGSLSTRDALNLNFTRRLSDRISAGFGVRAYQDESLNDTIIIFEERDYIQLRAQLTWQLSRNLSLDANYRYTFIDRCELCESANSNSIIIWLNYRPKPFIRSR